ncbi:MAG: hypothetical protein AVDCRST_MAG73-3715, partial [uncultured Thermomicrobiales bacterium]
GRPGGPAAERRPSAVRRRGLWRCERVVPARLRRRRPHPAHPRRTPPAARRRPDHDRRSPDRVPRRRRSATGADGSPPMGLGAHGRRRGRRRRRRAAVGGIAIGGGGDGGGRCWMGFRALLGPDRRRGRRVRRSAGPIASLRAARLRAAGLRIPGPGGDPGGSDRPRVCRRRGRRPGGRTDAARDGAARSGLSGRARPPAPTRSRATVSRTGGGRRRDPGFAGGGGRRGPRPAAGAGPARSVAGRRGGAGG